MKINLATMIVKDVEHVETIEYPNGIRVRIERDTDTGKKWARVYEYYPASASVESVAMSDMPRGGGRRLARNSPAGIEYVAGRRSVASARAIARKLSAE